MELAITLGLWGWIAVIAGALLFGVLAQFIGETRTGYEWLIDAIAAGTGAIVASEFIVAWQSYGPMFDEAVDRRTVRPGSGLTQALSPRPTVSEVPVRWPVGVDRRAIPCSRWVIRCCGR